MASIRSEDSGIVRADRTVVSASGSQRGGYFNNLAAPPAAGAIDRRTSQVSFSQAAEEFVVGGKATSSQGGEIFSTNNNNTREDSQNDEGSNFPAGNHHTLPGGNASSSYVAGGGSTSPSRSRRSVWREVINAVRAHRELLVDSFIKIAFVQPKQQQHPQNQDQDDSCGAAAAAARDRYPSLIPSFLEHQEMRLPPQRVITAQKPNAMRNRALAAMAVALSTLTLEMTEYTSSTTSPVTDQPAADVALPTALKEAKRLLAPVTVEDITINGKVPLDMLSQSMITIFEAQDILQKCIAASSVLGGKFEVKVAPASVLLVDTEDDWGTGFEIAPRRLAYKASELEESLSDVLRRRGVALVFFDKKALVEGMKQDDIGGDSDDEDQHSKLQALLNSPLNEDGTVGGLLGFDGGANESSSVVGGLFNGSFAGSGRGVPIAMQALRTRRTDIRESDCGFVLGPTRQAESVALAVTQWNRERDELELIYTEVTATALLDAMAMRSANTGRPQGFLALMPLHDLPLVCQFPGTPNSVNATTAALNTSSNDSPGQSSQPPSPQENPILGASSGMVVGGPNISALEIVASSAVTLDSVFPTFASLTQYHCEQHSSSEDAISASTLYATTRIPLGHIDHSIATHVTCCAVGTAATTGTLGSGLPVNEIVNTVNLSDVHMSVESDNTLQVHEVFSYMLQYSLRNPSAHLDVEWCPVVQTVHRANAAATVSVEQLCETLQLVRDASSAVSSSTAAPSSSSSTSPLTKKPLNVVMIAKVRIDIAIGTQGNSINGTGGGTRWLVICGYNEDSSMVTVLDPAPKRFGLFWSVSAEQLHRALTGHGYIILSNKYNTVGRSSADYIVCRPETHQIVLQAGIAYDSPDAVLPFYSQLPPRPIARCPLSLAACAISRITGRNVTFSQFLRSLPHPAPYGFTEDISLAHFSHVTRTFCHEQKLPIKMTLCHLSVDAQGARAVDEKEFSDRLAAAASSPRHAVIVNYGVTAFTSCCRSDRGTGAFALLLGFIPQDGRFNRYDRVLLQDCSDFVSQQVFSVEVNELYRACCDVCTVSRRTMGFIDLRFVAEEESVSPMSSVGSYSRLIDPAGGGSSGNNVLASATSPSTTSPAAILPLSTASSSGVINREQNVSVALEGNLATSNWEAIALARHPELPRHMFRSPAIPIFTAASAALVSLGLSCAEADIVASSFARNAAETKYEHLPTVLQAKPPTLAVARSMLTTFLSRSSSGKIRLLAAEKTNLLSALQAMVQHPTDIRIVLQYDCRVVHATIRKFVSAGVVSAVKGAGERALIRVLEAETASFLDVWEARAGALMKTFDECLDDNVHHSEHHHHVHQPTTGVLVMYRCGANFDEAIFTKPVTLMSISDDEEGATATTPNAAARKRPEPLISRASPPPGGNLITSAPSSPMMSHHHHHHVQNHRAQLPQVLEEGGGEDHVPRAARSIHNSSVQNNNNNNNNDNNNNNNNNTNNYRASSNSPTHVLGASRSRAMPYSLNAKKSF